ncbi:hypothetical protein DCC81_25165 [Chitinophaga parva]|uniref:Uncharacterized protein n=1 Tax=Chitinophaga parva TaxID=2169414 RepID=A0A2T7BB80_9BACT|nr:hypothetical protein [Chitinophaga parva]PUZ21301.1 hypothetical protein DCC81_25165 [Chitinophaga parva]
MNIELKDIHFREDLELNSDPFHAQLYVDGKRVCTVFDDGSGGQWLYTQFSAGGEQLKKAAEIFCEQMPPINCAGIRTNGEDILLDMNLELYITNLLREHLKKELERKIGNAASNCIIYGRPEGSISMLHLGEDISELSRKPGGRLFLQLAISRKVLPDLKPGDIIFNTNIAEEILKKAGLSSDQYRADLLFKEVESTPRRGKKPGRKL